MKIKANKKLLLKCGIRLLLKWLGVASESVKDCEQIRIFGTFKKNISSKLPAAKTSHFSKNWRPHFNSQLFLSLIFFKTLTGLETFLNCV